MDRATGTPPNDFIGHVEPVTGSLTRPRGSLAQRHSFDRDDCDGPDLVKARLEAQWPTWERRFDDAIDLVNSALARRERPPLQRVSSSPRWESCLGFPSDDIVNDGYYALHWAAIGWPGTGSERPRVSGSIADTSWLRTALHHAVDRDYIFIEWRKVEWQRLTLSAATPKAIAQSIVRLIEGDARSFAAQ